MEGGSCHQQPSCGGHRKLLCAGLTVTGKLGSHPLCPGRREQGRGPGLRVSQSSVGGLSEGREGTCLKGPLGEPWWLSSYA